jgi:hypothetical protein
VIKVVVTEQSLWRSRPYEQQLKAKKSTNEISCEPDAFSRNRVAEARIVSCQITIHPDHRQTSM